MAKETITRVPLDRLAESPMNPRRIRDNEADAGFAASVKEQGVLVPLLVRKNGSNGKFEILAGSRRYRAAKKAGLKDVPTIVMELDDKGALEVIIVENLQRADIHPLDEADGFADLLERSNGDFGAVSSRVHKPKAYVANRARLSNLSKSWRKMWMEQDDADFTVDHATQLARLEQKTQEELFKSQRGLPTISGLRKAIKDGVLMGLARAPWSKQDTDLVKKAGSCEACPKRSGSSKDLFSDIKGGDTCTDRNCFGEKLAAHAKLIEADAKKLGKKFVLLADEWYSREKDVIGTGKWKRIKADEKCKFAAIGLMSSLESKRFGQKINVCADHEKCSKHHDKGQYSSSSLRDEKTLPSKAVRQKKREKNVRIRRQLEENQVTLDHILVVWKPNLEDMREVVETFWERLWGDNKVILAMRRGWIKKRAEMHTWGRGAFDFKRQILPKMKSLQEMYTFMLEASLVGDLGREGDPNIRANVKTLAKRWEVDAKAVKADVDAAEGKRAAERTARVKAAAAERKKLKAKAKGKKKAKAKGKAKAKIK